MRVGWVHNMIAFNKTFSLKDFSILVDFLAVFWVTNAETSILLIVSQIAVSF